jgi:hypothetical protein
MKWQTWPVIVSYIVHGLFFLVEDESLLHVVVCSVRDRRFMAELKKGHEIDSISITILV